MDKYFLLIVLNLPFAVYGLFNVLLAYKLKHLRPGQTVIRVLFWLTIISGLLFTRSISDLLYNASLTDSPPLSIFDVILVTGIMISLSLIARAYGRIGELEDRITKLHEQISINLSNRKT